MQKPDLIVILGITATGKTSLAAHLAAKIGAEIISADSRQVYRGMDIGTGKDLKEFEVNNKFIPYHLIDIVDAGEEYNVFKYQQDFLKVYADIKNRDKKAILCGGTGLYLDAVLKGYRFLEIPENKLLREELNLLSTQVLIEMLKQYKALHNTSDTQHKKRLIRAIEIAKYENEHEALKRNFPTINHQLFGIQFYRETIKKRITHRLKIRLEEEGMIEEVEKLLNNGVNHEKLQYYGLEYKFISSYLLNEISKETLFEKLNIAIHQFAKRQATWFRRMEKQGYIINWIDGNLSMEEKLKRIEELL